MPRTHQHTSRQPCNGQPGNNRLVTRQQKVPHLHRHGQAAASRHDEAVEGGQQQLQVVLQHRAQRTNRVQRGLDLKGCGVGFEGEGAGRWGPGQKRHPATHAATL